MGTSARTTNPVRVSYPTLFTPRAFQAGQTPKYGVVLMFDKKDKEQMASLTVLKADCEAALAEKWPDATKRPRIPVVGDTRSPIKDGDKTTDSQGIPLCEKNEEYAGHYIIRANSTNRPVVVDKAMNEIIDTNEVYGGCFCKVNLNAYAFEQPTNKGVTFGLNGVQKWGDGESFGGGRIPVDDMFEPGSGQDDPGNYDDIPF